MTPQSTQANPMISLFLLDINHKIRSQYDAHIKHMQGMIRLSVLVATVYRYMRARHIQYTCMIVATSTSSADMPLVPTLLSKSETLGRRKCGPAFRSLRCARATGSSPTHSPHSTRPTLSLYRATSFKTIAVL